MPSESGMSLCVVVSGVSGLIVYVFVCQCMGMYMSVCYTIEYKPA